MDDFRAEPPSSHSNRLLRLEYAEVLIALGQTARAAVLLDEAEAAFKAADDMATQRGAWLRTVRGELAFAQGDQARGDAWFEQVLQETAARKDPPGSFVPRFAAAVARTRPQRERADAVLALLRKQELLPSRPNELNLDIEDKARLEFALGRLYLALDRPDEARLWLAAAVQLRETLDAAQSPWLAEAQIALAEALHTSGR
jgi:tetratricopeptide (TPR) repeat protein